MSNTVEFTHPEPPKEFKRPKPFYDEWQDGEGIPIYNCFHVPDLATIELKPWAAMAARPPSSTWKTRTSPPPS